MTAEPPPACTTLLVLYTDLLEGCRRFYADLGLVFAAEQHGNGPRHYAAVLDGGMVLELYPATPQRRTGSIRLGFAVPRAALRDPREPGRHLLTDPDGRTVELHVSSS